MAVGRREFHGGLGGCSELKLNGVGPTASSVLSRDTELQSSSTLRQ